MKTKDSSTSNLYLHLKNHHPLRYAEISKVSKIGKSHSKLKRPSKIPSQQPTMISVIESKTKYSRDSEHHKALTDSITRYIISGKAEPYINTHFMVFASEYLISEMLAKFMFWPLEAMDC